jgi:hypothetical protein
MMEAVRTSEMSIRYETKRRHVPECCHVHTLWHKNMKYHKRNSCLRTKRDTSTIHGQSKQVSELITLSRRFALRSAAHEDYSVHCAASV